MSKVGGNANEAEEKQLWTRQASTPHARRQNATRHRVNQPAAAGSRDGGRTRAWRPAVREVAMTSDATPSSPLRDTVRAGVRDLRAVWWWFLIMGVLWTWFGMFVLSYRVGSLVAVAALVGVAFLFGGVTQLAVATRVQSWRWLFIVAWYLIFFGGMHLVAGLAGPKVAWWWTQLLLGGAELVLGVWAIRSYQRSLLTLVTLVGVWAIVHGVNEIFAAFSLREAGKRVERLVG